MNQPFLSLHEIQDPSREFKKDTKHSIKHTHFNRQPTSLIEYNKNMSGPSLSESIFGDKGNNRQEKDHSLSNLFGSSTSLPEKPNNLNFTEFISEYINIYLNIFIYI